MSSNTAVEATDLWRPLALIRRLIDFRYGIAFIVILAGWTVATALWGPVAIVANAMKLETYLQLTAVVALNFVAVVFSVSLLRVLFERYPKEHGTAGWLRKLFGNGDVPWLATQYFAVILVGLPTPLVLSTTYGSEFSGLFAPSNTTVMQWMHVSMVAASLLVGAALAWAFLSLLGFIKTRLFGSEKETENFLPFENVKREGVLTKQSAVSSPKHIRGGFLPFEAIDYQLATYALLLAVIHFVSTRLFASLLLPVVTAPLVIILIVWIAFMLLVGLAYWLDKVRIPVVVALLIFMILTNLVMDRNYTLEPLPVAIGPNLTSSVHAVVKAESNAMLRNEDRAGAVKDAAKPLEDIAWQAVSERMKLATHGDQAKKRIVIIVTCPGGGIHAAAWSTYVLETLSRDFPRFRDSVCVISGVSGGSVGTLFFASTTYGAAIIEDDSFTSSDSAFKLATESSLEQISVGLMTDDLYGAFLPFLSEIDRGQRLENSFKERLPQKLRELTLNHWGKIAEAGQMPIVVFNATDAVTGRRILFDSLPTPIRKSNIGLTSRPFNYRELLGAADHSRDLLPMSAARASASFPYVSTFTSVEGGNEIGRNVAIGDGGYVDNEGIVTAVDWVQFLLERWSSLKVKDRPFDQILVLRIIPAVSSDSLAPPSSSWLAKNMRWLTGPLETIANVRGTSQAERGNLETDLAALYLSSPTIDTAPDQQPDETAENVTKVYGMSPDESLSKPANRTRDEASRERYLDRLKKAVPEQWNKLQQDNTMKTSAPPVTAVVGPEMDSSSDLPVLVIEIPFEPESELHVVPLNWKLTREQKGWYEKAWSRVETSQWEDFETLRSLFNN